MLAQCIESIPRFIATLSAPLSPQEELVRIPLALTGHWTRGASEFSITRHDLESIVRNFGRRQNGEINVDYDHASEMPEVAAGGPIPSAGRIVKMDPPEEWKDAIGKVQTDKTDGANLAVPASEPRFILYGWYEPTDRARRLIANREYRYISPAIDWAARSKRSGKSLGATLSTVALTNRPFLEEMPPIRLSDPEYRLVENAATPDRQAREDNRQDSNPENNSAGPESPVSNFEFPVSSIETPVLNVGGVMKTAQLSVVDGKVKITHEGQELFADPADLKACAASLGFAATLPSDEAVRAAGAKTHGRARAFLSEADAEGKSVSALELFRGEVDRELESAVRSGKILPRRRDDWRKIALADLPAFRRIVADQKPQVPLRPVGFAGAAPEGAQTQVKLLAEQRMRERDISFGQALSEISREQPELAREYRRAVSSSQ
jgi:Mu-like prophage I protein